MQPYRITTNNLQLQDNTWLNFDELTENKIESVFRLEPLPVQSYERPDTRVQVVMTLERNLNLTVISRDGYNVLDWFSDIGGIQGIFISAIALFLGLWNYNSLDNFMA